MNKLKQLANPVIMWAVVAFGAVVLYFAVPKHPLFDGGMAGKAVLAIGALNWVWITVQAAKVNRQPVASVENIDQLVTEGAYSVVRHPMYLADVLLAWSFFVYHAGTRTLAIVVWLDLVLLFWANWEERLLEEKFLDDYRAYKRRVPMFVPRFGSYKKQ